ncbi:MAG TPA: Uma2 family endonuclease [Acetobacteraceae bacterium]|nr:Uma2 family endonuclease [Acetobacteraceae bacterium]
MNIVLRRPPMSVDEFLAWENRQVDRWEFDGFEPQAMVGGTLAHNHIIVNLVTALRSRLPNRCRVYAEGVKLRLAHTVRYPDVMVACGPFLPTATDITDPSVVFEVLSPGTFGKDRIEKNREYAATPSIRHYMLLEQDAIAAEVDSRDGDRWVRSTVTGDGLLVMPEIGVEMPLAEAYAGLELGVPGPA